MKVRAPLIGAYTILLGCQESQAQSLTSSVNDARNDIARLILADDKLGPKFLRLAFHDAVGGGNNGCVDLENEDNNGLVVPIEALEPVVNKYATFATGLSRADIWVLASMVACQEAQRFISFPMLHFGRVDCDNPESNSDCTSANGNSRTCSSTTGPVDVLPGPDLTTQQLLRFFSEEFNFSAQETVAIMGAHTLGELSRENSGFDGSNGWVDGKADLDNEYYKLMVGGDGPDDSIQNLVLGAPGWSSETVDNGDLHDTPDRFQWTRHAENGGDDLIMLNADVAIFRDLENNLNGSNEATCRFSGNRGNVCPHAAATLQFAADYRFDNDLWLNDFRDAMTVMTTAGYSTALDCSGDRCLRLVRSAHIIPTPTPTPAPTLPTSEPLALTSFPTIPVPATTTVAMLTSFPTKSPVISSPTSLAADAAVLDTPVSDTPVPSSSHTPTVSTESPTSAQNPPTSGPSQLGDDLAINSNGLEPSSFAISRLGYASTLCVATVFLVSN